MSAPERISSPGERHARRASAQAAPAPARPRRGRGRRRGFLHHLSTVLIAVGAFLATDATVTLVWEEPLTHVFTQHQQAVLGDDLHALRTAPPTVLERRGLAGLRGTRERIAFLARSLEQHATEGSAIGEIRLPRIREHFVVVKGTDAEALRKGPGAYDDVGLPGTRGTAAIAGHRTTYGAPFRHIDRLRRGDAIVVVMPYATFTYRVERTRIVQPDDLSVLARRRYDRLVLSACHPLYSAAQRIVVFARLASTVPSGVLSPA